MTRLLPLIIFLSVTTVSGQKKVTVNGMQFSYILKDTTIEIELHAPTLGWLGIGFNDQNSIVKSDLYLLRVKNKKAEGLDMYVVGAGNPKEDDTIGGTRDLKVIDGEEINGATTITFRIPFNSRDTYDFSHKVGADFWLILAYSQSDDYDHHSLMRKHMKFSFTK